MTTIFGAIILFLILVTFHEYGHYSVARFFKIKILKFSIGFGPDIFTWKNKDNVRFSLSSIPFGGYVAFHDPHDVENYKKLSESEKKYVLANRPAPEKMLVTLAGPIFNFILSFVIFSFVALFIPKQPDVLTAKFNKIDGEQYYKVISVNDRSIKNVQDFEISLLNLSGFTGNIVFNVYDYTSGSYKTFQEEVKDLAFSDEQAPSAYFSIEAFNDYSPIIGSIAQGSIAEEYGLKDGDKINVLNNLEVLSLSQLNNLLQNKKQKSLQIERDGEILFLSLPSIGQEEFYGIALSPESNNFIDSLRYGWDQTLFWIVNTFKFLAKMITGNLGVENLSGPVGIAKVAGDSLSSGLIPFLLLTAILSISLGAFNLLPLPMLDGGQFLFILFEEVIGTPINMKLKVALFNLSYMFILALFIFVVYNDLMRIF